MVMTLKGKKQNLQSLTDLVFFQKEFQNKYFLFCMASVCLFCPAGVGSEESYQIIPLRISPDFHSNSTWRDLLEFSLHLSEGENIYTDVTHKDTLT
jgi:hypothetical protein